MLNHNPNFTYLALVFIITILYTQSCTQEQMSKTGIMRKEDKSFDPLSAIVGVQVGRSSTSATTTAPVSVILPETISALQSCGLVCAYQYDFAFSIKNTLSESVTVTKIFEEYLATKEDTTSVCSSTWENGIFNSTSSTCGSFNIFANGVIVSSSYTVLPASTIPLSINNTGYQIRVGYIRITITYTNSTGTVDTANAISPTKF
jgi:hypothetical protein